MNISGIHIRMRVTHWLHMPVALGRFCLPHMLPAGIFIQQFVLLDIICQFAATAGSCQK